MSPKAKQLKELFNKVITTYICIDNDQIYEDFVNNYVKDYEINIVTVDLFKDYVLSQNLAEEVIP